MKHIMLCKTCNLYTLKDSCPECGAKTDLPVPPKYSPDDKYAKYRREAKLEQRKKEGVL